MSTIGILNRQKKLRATALSVGLWVFVISLTLFLASAAYVHLTPNPFATPVVTGILGALSAILTPVVVVRMKRQHVRHGVTETTSFLGMVDR